MVLHFSQIFIGKIFLNGIYSTIPPVSYMLNLLSYIYNISHIYPTYIQHISYIHYITIDVTLAPCNSPHSPHSPPASHIWLVAWSHLNNNNARREVGVGPVLMYPVCSSSNKPIYNYNPGFSRKITFCFS